MRQKLIQLNETLKKINPQLCKNWEIPLMVELKSYISHASFVNVTLCTLHIYFENDKITGVNCGIMVLTLIYCNRMGEWAKLDITSIDEIAV